MHAESADILAIGQTFLALAEAHGVRIVEVIQAANERLVAGRLRHDAAMGVPVVPAPEMPPAGMRPLLSYYGGKQRLAQRIVDWLPPHTVYVEPFCGGSAVFFAKGTPAITNRDHYREVLNDHDQRIMAVYQACQHRTTREALIERLTYTPHSRAAYQESRAIQRAWDDYDPVSQAWSIVVDLQQSFSGQLGGGLGTSVYGRNHAASWANWRDALPAMMERLREVHLECDDAMAVIKRWDSPQTIFYCDPPYIGADQGHYKGYTMNHFKALVDVLDTCQGSFVLSGYAACLPDIPAAWEVQTIDAYASSTGQGMTAHYGHARRTRAATADELGDRRRTEYLWRVDRSHTMRPELRALFRAKAPVNLSLFED
jgi:DNA adenine methylase